MCQFHRGIIRGCAALRAQSKGTELAALTVRMHPFEADFFGVRFPGPFTTFPQAFMSAPFCAALAWARGDATLAGLTDFTAPDVPALINRIAIVADASRERYDPLITARLADGVELTWHMAETANAYMLTWEAATAMTGTLLAEVGLAQTQADGLIAAVSGLSECSDVNLAIAAMDAICRTVRGPVNARVNPVR